MTGRSLIILACVGLALVACGRKDEQVTFDGHYFRAKAERASKEERDHFVVGVRDVSQGLNAALEAGRYEGTKYCIRQYGTSRIDWVVGPDTETIVPTDDTIQMEGYCRP